MARTDEPDDGGLDWLQSQLGGAEESDEPNEQAEPDPVEPAASETAAFEFPAFESPEPPTAKLETSQQPAPTDDPGSATDVEASGSAFSWGLTPMDAEDPHVDPDGEPAQERAEQAGAATEPPVVPATPLTPAGADLPTAARVDAAETTPLTPAETPAGSSAAEDRGIRTDADLEPAPWWTTPVQSPLVPTDEERESGLFPTPMAAAPTTQHTTPSADAHAEPVRGGRRRPSPAAGGAGTTANPNATRTLIWVAAALGAVIVLVGLFFLGRQIVGGTPVAAPSPTETSTPTPAPTPPPAPTAPLPAGVHAWDTLFGGECLEPYASPWDEEFTVVDCATPHTAQLVYRGVFPGDATTAFPGEEALASQINLLCSAPGVIDLAAAGGLPDLQLQGSYPVADEQWTSGQRNYYCFVSRSSGEPLTASIAGPGPAPAA